MAIDGESSAPINPGASEDAVKDNILLAHAKVKSDNKPERRRIYALPEENNAEATSEASHTENLDLSHVDELEDIIDLPNDSSGGENMENENRANQKPNESAAEPKRTRPVTHMGEGPVGEPRTSTKDALDYFVNVSNAVNEWPGMPDVEKQKVEAKWDEFIKSRREDVLDYAGEYPELKRQVGRLLDKGLSQAGSVSAEAKPAEALSDVAVDEVPKDDTATKSESSETPPVDKDEIVSKLNDSSGTTPFTEQDPNGITSFSEDPNGTTPFPAENEKDPKDDEIAGLKAENKSVKDENAKLRSELAALKAKSDKSPLFANIDDYPGPGTFNNAIMSERDKHEFAKAQMKTVDSKSRWQKFVDKIKPSKTVTTTTTHTTTRTYMPTEASETGAVKTDAEIIASYNEDIARAKEDIKLLWSHIPEDKRKSDSLVMAIDGIDGGDIDKYFEARKKDYEATLGADKVFDQLSNIDREARFVRGRVMDMVGTAEAERILNEAKASGTTPAEDASGTTPAEEAVITPAESIATTTPEPVSSPPEPTAEPSQEDQEQQIAEEQRQISEMVLSNPNYTAGMELHKNDPSGVEIRINKDGAEVWTGNDDMGWVPTDLRTVGKIVDKDGNVLFDQNGSKPSSNGVASATRGESSAASGTRSDEI